MIRLLLAALTLSLFGCRSDKPETGSNEELGPTPAELEALAVKKASLLNEKLKLGQELDRLIAGANLDSNAQLKVIKDSIQQTQAEFTEIRQTHPRLLKLNRDLAKWQGEARSARSSGRADLAAKANSKMMAIRGEIRETTSKIPEIATLEESILDLQQQAKDLRHTLAGQTPEGKKIMERITAIEAEIKNL